MLVSTWPAIAIFVTVMLNLSPQKGMVRGRDQRGEYKIYKSLVVGTGDFSARSFSLGNGCLKKKKLEDRAGSGLEIKLEQMESV